MQLIPFGPRGCHLRSVQYNVALAITDALRGTSRKKLYQKLGLESFTKQEMAITIMLFLQNFINKIVSQSP